MLTDQPVADVAIPKRRRPQTTRPAPIAETQATITRSDIEEDVVLHVRVPRSLMVRIKAYADGAQRPLKVCVAEAIETMLSRRRREVEKHAQRLHDLAVSLLSYTTRPDRGGGALIDDEVEAA